MKRISLILATILLAFTISACSPSKGIDKTAYGSTLGAGLGATSGAIIGNQVNNSPEGAAVGATVGLLSGLSTGLMYDGIEKKVLQQQEEIKRMRIQNEANSHRLARIQHDLDRAIATDVYGGMYQVFFDVDQTNLRSGSIANLETIAESIKRSPRAYRINVMGHADDTGSPKYNERLAESRARAVASYLAGKGISNDQIFISSEGSKLPIASNATETGRQLNRRVDITISN